MQRFEDGKIKLKAAGKWQKEIENIGKNNLFFRDQKSKLKSN